MIKNLGKTDKIIRIVLGLTIGVIGLYFKNWFGIIGIIPILTAVISWCPFYVPFKINTIKN